MFQGDLKRQKSYADQLIKDVMEVIQSNLEKIRIKSSINDVEVIKLTSFTK